MCGAKQSNRYNDEKILMRLQGEGGSKKQPQRATSAILRHEGVLQKYLPPHFTSVIRFDSDVLFARCFS